MTPEEAYNLVCKKYGQKVYVSFVQEYDHVYGFRLRPGEFLCVVKSTGEVIWEEDLPDKFAPSGKGTTHYIGRNW